ncbi:MAG: iron ABC transporter permease [Candidatus Muiribacteriota bacterium]
MLSRKLIIKYIVFFSICFVLFVAALFMGEKYNLSDERQLTIFLNLRLSRVILGFLAGGILALAGLSFQTLFQNSLASPFTLGIASGASLGAAVVMKTGFIWIIPGISALMAGSFAGALLSVLFIYTIVNIKKSDRSYVLLLGGVAFNFFASSIVLFLQYVGDLSVSFRLARWTMGTLDSVDFIPVLRLIPFFLLIISVSLYYYRELDILVFGEELAAVRGVDVKSLEIKFFIIVSMAVGSVVSLCGPIAFVGLMVPHIVKQIFDIKHFSLSIACIIAGGSFLVFCDGLSRILITGSQIPVGIITSFLGAPFFLFLLLKK